MEPGSNSGGLPLKEPVLPLVLVEESEVGG